MGNTFGTIFRITTWGESHGAAVGCVIDGCPSRLALDESDIQHQLDRRRPGQSKLTTQRREADQARILSGVVDGMTLGTPIVIAIENSDARSKDYDELSRLFRPSHADFTYNAKYAIRAHAGGGRASARETIGRVAAGAVAQKLLSQQFGIEVTAWVEQVGDIVASIQGAAVTVEQVDANDVRCPDPEAAAAMIEAILEARKDGDSLGGVISCTARGVPAGWGEPVFDKLEAELARAMLSIPACKGFESGSGFAGAKMRGSTHNDPFYHDADSGKIRTRTNYSGGIQGGISNGEHVDIRLAFKPTATILKPQETVTVDGKPATYTGRGRHDPCVLPRAVPIVEAMMALVLLDQGMRHRSRSV